jgi:hypothetical protein
LEERVDSGKFQYRYPLVTLFLTATAASGARRSFPPKFISKAFAPFMESVFQIGFG